MKISPNQIQGIAEELQIGFDVYLNMNTGEYHPILNLKKAFHNRLLWEKELNLVKSKWDNYTIIAVMEPWQLFDMMHDFTLFVDGGFYQELKIALRSCKSFMRFKHLVNNSPYREQWNEYRDNHYINYVKNRLKQEREFDLEVT